MSRVVRLVPRGTRSILSLSIALALLAPPTSAVPVAAQDLPACGPEVTSDCRLPSWPERDSAGVASPFGEVDGMVWVEDDPDDAPPGGLDILAVGLGRVDIDDPGSIRRSDALIKLGRKKKAVNDGTRVLVRIVLDRPPSTIDAGHAGVHVATDVDGSRSNNAPAGVANVGNPFAGSQDVYSLTYAATTGKSRLLKSDLARGWYKAKDPYAAMWAAPDILDMAVPTEEFGDAFRVITFASGEEGGYDRLDVASAPIPSDGRVGLLARCIEGSISTSPFTVRRLVENGQTLRNVDAPASWRVGASFPASREVQDALRAARVVSDDGERSALASTVSLFEDGIVIRQRPEIDVHIEGDEVQLALELGLTRRGFNVLRHIELQPTGEDVADAWLERATDALVRSVPPFRLGKKPGLVAGDAVGGCIPVLAGPLVPDDGGTPGDAVSPDDPAVDGGAESA